MNWTNTLSSFGWELDIDIFYTIVSCDCPSPYQYRKYRLLLAFIQLIIFKFLSNLKPAKYPYLILYFISYTY